jgi:hypothetical protein
MIHAIKLRLQFEWRLYRRKRIRMAEQKRAAFWKAEKRRAV